MALKSKLSKSEFDELPDVLKEHYKESNGSYLLDSDEATELRRAKERADEEKRQEKERADRLQRERDEQENERRRLEEETARKKGDVTAIENSWKTKVEEAERKGEEAANGLREQLRNILVGEKATLLAAEISTAPSLILPHIKARLVAELDGDAAITRVLDKEGKPSSLSMEDLKKEFIANPEYAAIIKGSNANGGGAGGGGAGGGAGSKKFTEMSEPERVALYKQSPEEYRRIAKEAGVNIVGVA